MNLHENGNSLDQVTKKFRDRFNFKYTLTQVLRQWHQDSPYLLACLSTMLVLFSGFMWWPQELQTQVTLLLAVPGKKRWSQLSGSYINSNSVLGITCITCLSLNKSTTVALECNVLADQAKSHVHQRSCRMGGKISFTLSTYRGWGVLRERFSYLNVH